MRARLAIRRGFAVAGLTAAGAFGFTAAATPAGAEPECLTGSNDFDRDGTVDVAVGMPGRANGAGAVEVRISGGGDERVVRVGAPAAAPGDRFGAALAEIASFRTAGEEDRCSQLVVGAPGRDVDGKGDAGAVFVYRYDDLARDFVLVQEFARGAAGVPGAPRTGDRFGTALAAVLHYPGFAEVVTRLYVGVPGADVGGAADAGALVTFAVDGDTAVEASQVTQGGDVPGVPESGDAFGRSLADTGAGVLVGVPGENDGAGGVVQWNVNPAATNAFVNQDSPGVPGVAEPGDRYGAALYFAREILDADDRYTVLVGAPREDVGAARNAGTVHLFTFGSVLRPSGVVPFTQATPGVPGVPESGDLFGSALGTVGRLDPLIGVPGEDVGGLADAGIVSLVHANRMWSQDSERMPGAAEAGDRFGATIGNARIPFPGEVDAGWPDSPLIGAPGENAAAGFVISGVTSAGSPFPTPLMQLDPRPGDGYGSALGKVN